LRLFDTPRAPNPRRVRWVMAEKGIDDIEIVTLNILDGAHKAPEYLARTGAPVVPALEMDDGTTITESIAICRYLESRYPQPNLFGRTPQETAVIEMWLRRAEMLVAQPLMMAVRLSHPALAVLESPSPAVADYNRASGLAGLAVLDRRLGESEWLAGDRLTIADIVAFIGVDFTRMIKLQLPDNLTNFSRWADAMRARPAAAL
jgi:glutathione S-transferase